MLRVPSDDLPIGVLYEHPEWFRPLFAELDRRGIPYERLDASSHSFDPAAPTLDYSLIVNRMSPSAWLRGHGRAVFHTLHYLACLEAIGAPVLNGYRAFSMEISKAAQVRLFASLGVLRPRAYVINDPSLAPVVSERLRFPVLVKPNIGGSGAGIRSFESPRELAEAARRDDLDLGPDQTGLVQERLPARGEAIYRVEILGDRFLYAIRLQLEPGSFNLCPADYCAVPGLADGVSGRGLPVERVQPPADLVATARRIIQAAGMDLGGVEYLVNERDGKPYFYDINALSNFVAEAPAVVGFDPFEDLVDLIVDRARTAQAALAH